MIKYIAVEVDKSSYKVIDIGSSYFDSWVDANSYIESLECNNDQYSYQIIPIEISTQNILIDMDEDSKEVCYRAFNSVGIDSQLNYLIEELSELISASSHVKRGRDNSSDEFVAELVDVLITLYPIIYSNPQFINLLNSWLNTKISRLNTRYPK